MFQSDEQTKSSVRVFMLKVLGGWWEEFPTLAVRVTREKKGNGENRIFDVCHQNLARD